MFNKFDACVIHEFNETFVIVTVDNAVIDNMATAQEVITALKPTFHGTPIILMSQSYNQPATYLGRQDLVKYVRNLTIENLDFKEYYLK
jgi:hypothetical protein